MESEWVGSGFNDLFGFFISGPDSAGGSFINKNIAIVPNTTSTVVSVNNINNGTTNAGPCMNCAYYVDNTNDTTIAFDGFTTVLVAQVSVIPLATYHLKMAIADASDNVYDTGIFLKAQSMKSYSTSTPVIPQLVMSPPASLTQMVNDFILSGVTANNMSYTGDSSAVGVFSDGNLTNLGLTNGIFLTTGVINGTPAIGDSAMLFANTFNNTAGDALLHSLIPSSPTFDASVLEFDLVPSGNILEFQYVFASEEYPEFVGSNFNDVFGFFINGLDPAGGYYVDKNLAIIPGTSSVVCVNNVNDTTNASYYVNNQNGGTLVFDGFTTVLLAQANVIPSTTYHLKMAIADVADGSFDSGIFLKAQSMKSYSNVSVKENQGQHFYIAPNPVNADSKLTVNLQTSGKVKINITDISGKKVYSNEINFTSAGMQQISLSDFMNTTKAGIYMISIEANNFSETQKIIRY